MTLTTSATGFMPLAGLPTTAPAPVLPPVRPQDPAGLLQLWADADLRGRGGGGFPLATKLASAQGRRPRLIVNACESDPWSAKDRYLVENQWSEIAAGIAAVADTVGASEVLIAVGAQTEIHQRLQIAGVPGIQASLLVVEPRLVSSESSALAAAAAGRPALPLHREVPLSIASPLRRFGRRPAPVVVSNVETMWGAGRILSKGAAAWRERGTAAEPGPRWVTVSMGTRRAVVVAHAGERIDTIVHRGFGRTVAPAALSIGGLWGSWVPAPAWRSEWSDAGLARWDADTGTGAIRLLAQGQCPMVEISTQLDVLAKESAGQCGPCMFGLPAVAHDWRLLVQHHFGQHRLGGAVAEVQQRIAQRAGLLPGRGACHHPDGFARVARTALTVFSHHVEDQSCQHPL